MGLFKNPVMNGGEIMTLYKWHEIQVRFNIVLVVTVTGKGPYPMYNWFLCPSSWGSFFVVFGWCPFSRDNPVGGTELRAI